MIWVIEFRSGGYLQSPEAMQSGPLKTAQQFPSEDAALALMGTHEWICLHGGMPVLVRVSRYSDLELAARIILRTMPPGSLSAPPSAVEMLQKKLENLAQVIWTQGWDCREEQGPLAGAFGHANRYNPYRRPPEPTKCRGCGESPLRTERGRCEDCGDCQGCGDEECHNCHDEIIANTIKGSEAIPGDAVATLQVFPEKGIPLADVVLSIEKLRDAPVPTMAYLTGTPCGQEGGVADPNGHTHGICTFERDHDGRHSWEPGEE